VIGGNPLLRCRGEDEFDEVGVILREVDVELLRCWMLGLGSALYTDVRPGLVFCIVASAESTVLEVGTGAGAKE
jgi:hypothetical protein